MDRKWLGLVETSVLTLPSGELLRMSREYAEREWDLAVGKFVGGWAQDLYGGSESEHARLVWDLIRTSEVRSGLEWQYTFPRKDLLVGEIWKDAPMVDVPKWFTVTMGVGMVDAKVWQALVKTWLLSEV